MIHTEQNQLFLRFLEDFPPVLLLYGDSGIGKKTFLINFLRDHFGSNSRDIKIYNEPYAIDDIRSLISIAKETPIDNKYKFMVLNKIDCISEYSSNVLLKILEEAPEFCKFILLTDNFDKILPTIRGRCFQIPFYPLAENELRDMLRSKGLEELPWIVKYSFGSIERAMYLSQMDSLIVTKTIIGLIENWLNYKVYETFSTIENLFGMYERDLIYAVFMIVVLDCWQIVYGLEAVIPYYDKQKIELACIQMGHKTFFHMYARLNELRCMKINDSFQIKEMLFSLLPVRGLIWP